MAASFAPTMIGHDHRLAAGRTPHPRARAATSDDLRCTSLRRSGSLLNEIEPGAERRPEHRQRRRRENERARAIHQHIAQRARSRHPRAAAIRAPSLLCESWRPRDRAGQALRRAPIPARPYIPVACASSTITTAPARSAMSHTSTSGVRSPSMLNTLSVMTNARPLRGLRSAALERCQILVRINRRRAPSSGGCRRSGSRDSARPKR